MILWFKNEVSSKCRKFKFLLTENNVCWKYFMLKIKSNQNIVIWKLNRRFKILQYKNSVGLKKNELIDNWIKSESVQNSVGQNVILKACLPKIMWTNKMLKTKLNTENDWEIKRLSAKKKANSIEIEVKRILF